MTPRYEYKIPFTPAWLSQIETWIRLHPAHWRESYPPRQVNNIYFDSYDLRDLNANISGEGQRDKLRLRWYGPTVSHIKGAQMEHKRKLGNAGWKDVITIGVELELTQRPWSILMDHLRDNLENRARLWLDQRAGPVLISHYQRAYYESPDGVLRLTVDTQLRAYNQRGFIQPNLSRPVWQASGYVMELKAPVEDDAPYRLSQVLKSLPVRVERFSKYVQAMLAAPDLDGIRA